MDRQSGGGVDPEGLFLEGNPVAGVTGSRVFAKWGNMVTEELRNLVLEAGLTPVESNWEQVQQAVAILSSQNGSQPNLVINGGMAVWRRGLSVTHDTGGIKYVADRFYALAGGIVSDGSATISKQVVGSTGSPPENMRDSLLWDQTEAQAGSIPPTLGHRIEDVKTGAGKKLSVSWWQKVGPGAFPVTVKVAQNFGVGGAVSAQVDLDEQQTEHLPANPNWTRETMTFDLPSIAGKTLGPRSYVEIKWELPLGAVFNFQIAQVKAEIGSVATPFEYLAQGVDEIQCSRYYWTSYPHGTTPGTVTTEGAIRAFQEAQEMFGLDTRFPVAMRAFPSIQWYSTTTGGAGKIDHAGGVLDVVDMRQENNASTGYPVIGSVLTFDQLSAQFTADAEI